MQWDKLANDERVEKTANALRERGIEVFIVDNREEAKAKVLELLPKGAKVNMVSSTTLNQIGLADHVDNSDDYDSLGKRAKAISDPKERAEFRKSIMAPDYGIGSVHAVTEDGQLLDASATGSQTAVYAFGAANVIYVVGTQKIVASLDEGLKRIYEHVLPLENERMMKAYNMPSSVNRILIVEKEPKGRSRLVFVKEKLGF